MKIEKIINRLENYSRHWQAKNLRKKLFTFKSDKPVISFSFDDSPVSSYQCTKDLLDKYNIKASYYISTGLLDKTTEVGRILSAIDLQEIVKNDHELGCHTSQHGPAGKVSYFEYENQIIENSKNITQIIPNYRFKSFAYPSGYANYKIKMIAEKRFKCCRGIYEGINNGTIDLNMLLANNLYCSNNQDEITAKVNKIKNLIELNKRENGWLIFYSHDISDSPSAYGSNLDFFSRIVVLSIDSKSKILPIGDVIN